MIATMMINQMSKSMKSALSQRLHTTANPRIHHETSTDPSGTQVRTQGLAHKVLFLGLRSAGKSSNASLLNATVTLNRDHFIQDACVLQKFINLSKKMAESVASNLRYGGKVAIVSGGSKGIGEGIVREFGKQIENQQKRVRVLFFVDFCNIELT